MCTQDTLGIAKRAHGPVWKRSPLLQYRCHVNVTAIMGYYGCRMLLFIHIYSYTTVLVLYDFYIYVYTVRILGLHKKLVHSLSLSLPPFLRCSRIAMNSKSEFIIHTVYTHGQENELTWISYLYTYSVIVVCCLFRMQWAMCEYVSFEFSYSSAFNCLFFWDSRSAWILIVDLREMLILQFTILTLKDALVYGKDLKLTNFYFIFSASIKISKKRW